MYKKDFIINLKKTKCFIAFIILTTISIISITSYLLIEPIYNLQNIDNIIVEEFNNGTKLSGNRVEKVKGGFSAFDDYEYEIVLSKFDLVNPIYCFINKKNGSDMTYAQSITMKRNNINKFEIIEYSSALGTTDISYMKKTCQNGDISKQNLPPEIIFNPPQSLEQINVNREKVEVNNENEETYIYLKGLVKKYENSGNSDKAILSEVVNILKQVVSALENNQTYIFPDGSTLSPTPRHLEEMQEALIVYSEELKS